ncbi:MAG: metal ABC transporter substrate-binding protein [Actinomycetaceae bacterium]|nr:metal ABC transporter substrate-binding protein [Actinomycetaceae bacterium]
MTEKNKVIRALVVGAAMLATVLAGCGKGTAAVEHKKPQVLTTFTVIADMAKNVAGDRLDVSSITKPDAEIHDYQPTPEDIKRAEGADLILNNGLGLERWFQKFVSNTKAKTADLSEGVTPIPIAEGDYKGKPNPHAWMSPDAGVKYVNNIVKAFSALDPDGKAQYEANGRKYAAEIEKVGKEMEGELEKLPKDQRALVTCEGAFSYLARDTGLQEKYLWGVNAEGALTPARVADVENFVKTNKVPAVFCESTVGDKMKPVVQSTGAKFGGTLYVDSLSGPDGDVPTYLDLLRYDANLITKGLTSK